MATNYSRGRRYEYRTIKLLEAAGYECLRAAGSQDPRGRRESFGSLGHLPLPFIHSIRRPGDPTRAKPARHADFLPEHRLGEVRFPRLLTFGLGDG